jgi:hypothetical protein
MALKGEMMVNNILEEMWKEMPYGTTPEFSWRK